MIPPGYVIEHGYVDASNYREIGAHHCSTIGLGQLNIELRSNDCWFFTSVINPLAFTRKRASAVSRSHGDSHIMIRPPSISVVLRLSQQPTCQEVLRPHFVAHILHGMDPLLRSAVKVSQWTNYSFGELNRPRYIVELDLLNSEWWLSRRDYFPGL
jgi:hypothetical protein